MAQETAQQVQPADAPFADFNSRVSAHLIDFAVLGVVGLPIYGLYYLAATLGSLPSELLLALPVLTIALYIAYFAVLTARSGQTPGKRFMSIQVQNVSGGLPSGAMCAWRATVDLIFLNFIRIAIGLADGLWMLRQKDSRTLHDLAAGTVVRQIGEYPSGARITVAALLAVLVMLAAVSPHRLLVGGGTEWRDNMAPTVRNRESFAADRLAYRHRSPALGDVVSFQAEFGSAASFGSGVGRVVGLPGDRLAFRGGSVQRLAPAALKQPDEVVVPVSCVALSGDNHTTPTSASFVSHFAAAAAPPPPPPPPGAKPEAQPAGWPFASQPRPILTIRTADVTGRVIAVTGPFWRTRLVK